MIRGDDIKNVKALYEIIGHFRLNTYLQYNLIEIEDKWNRKRCLIEKLYCN